MTKKILFVVILLLTTFAGCKTDVLPSKAEISDFDIARVAGIDICPENPSEVEVTFISRLQKGASSNGEKGKQLVKIISATGSTVFDAERKVKAHSDKKAFFGHVDYFIFGEDTVKDDITKYFDFIMRDHEIRLSPKVYIIKNGSAKDFLNKTSTGDKFIADLLKNLEEDISLLSNFDEVNLIDVSQMLDNTKAATVIPALMLSDIKNVKMTGEMPEKEITLGGYAIVKDFKLQGYIDDDYSSGYNFLVNKVKSRPVSVKDQSGMYVGLEVISAKTTVETEFDGNELKKVIYKTDVISNIQEQQSRDNIFTEKELQDLCDKQSETIKTDMSKVIDLSKEYKIDCTQLWKSIKMKHPLKWEHLKDNWNEIYPDLEIEINVESHIARTYDIREASGYQAGR